ncbi:MAG: semialdehyde dehydrogenase, partial [Bacteroidota bacterium]
MPRIPFAFLVHPRADVRADAGRLWPPLRHLPERLLRRALEHPLPAVSMGTVHFADAPRDRAGHVLFVPVAADRMLRPPRQPVVDSVSKVIDRARRFGARIVGLGALTAPVTRGGRSVAGREDVGVTNGNAFTAAITAEATIRLLPHCPSGDPSIAIVGATGSVGSCTARLLSDRFATSRMTLVARNDARLGLLADEIRRPGLHVDTSTDMRVLRQADLVVLVTSAPGALLRPEHLKTGAIVLDDTQPRNTQPGLLAARPDVTLVDGGLVSVPGVDLKADLGLAPGTSFACLAETMLLALDGHDEDFCIGHPTLDQARHMEHLAT